MGVVSAGEECSVYDSGQYVQEKSVDGIMGAICAEEKCGGCDRGQYVHKRGFGGITAGKV